MSVAHPFARAPAPLPTPPPPLPCPAALARPLSAAVRSSAPPQTTPLYAACPSTARTPAPQPCPACLSRAAASAPMRRPSVLPCRSFVRPPVQLCPPPRAEPFPLPPPPPSRAAALSSHTPQPCPPPCFTAFLLRRSPVGPPSRQPCPPPVPPALLGSFLRPAPVCPAGPLRTVTPACLSLTSSSAAPFSMNPDSPIPDFAAGLVQRKKSPHRRAPGTAAPAPVVNSVPVCTPPSASVLTTFCFSRQ